MLHQLTNKQHKAIHNKAHMVINKQQAKVVLVDNSKDMNTAKL